MTFNKKKNLNIVFAIVILLVVSSSWIVPVIRSDPPINNDDPFIYYYPPVNSFGMSEYKTVNPVFLKNLIKNNMDWGLFYKRYSYSSWANGNEYLSVNLTWNNTINAFKIKLTFIAPVDIYQAEFRMGFNVNVLDFIEKNDNEIWFNYSTTEGNINLMFNYSDLKQINGLYFDKGIFNNRFYFLFGRFNIPKNLEGYVFDPIFGDNTENSGTQQVTFGYTQKERIVALRFYCDYTTTIDSISAYVLETDADDTIISKVAIYDNESLHNAITNGISNSVEVDGSSLHWETWDFTTDPTVTNGNYYWLCITGDGTGTTGTDKLAIGYSSSGSETTTYISVYDYYYPDFITDWSIAPIDTSSSLSIYATYTISGGGCVNETLINPVSTVNGTTNINPCVTLNWTTLINNTCGESITYANISCNGLYHNTSGVNDTYWLNITNLECGQSYTVYVNASSGGDVNNSWFTFSTLGCCEVTIEGIDNTTFLNYDYNLTYVNASAFINCSCNDTLYYINYSFNGNYHNETTPSEGFNYYNFTGLSLTCETDYKLYINSSCKTCNQHINNSWFWVNTSNCYTPFCCNYTLENPYPVNKTTGVNATLTTYVNFSVYLNTSCAEYNFSFVNISFTDNDGLNYSNQTNIAEGLIFVNMSVNLSCGQNYSWNILFSKNLTNCSIYNYSFWFRTSSCGGAVSCCDCFNDTCFTTLLNTWLISNGYVKESDFMDLAIANSQLSIFLTLVLFIFFFYSGYFTKRKSGGAFVMFSGFIFIGLSLLIGTYLNAIYVTPLMLPFAGFIILVGVKKWLYEDVNKNET